MTCYIQIEDGSGSLLLESSDFLSLESCEDNEILGGLPYVDPFTQRALWEAAQTAERKRIKEEEIIRIRLDAQDNLMRQRELRGQDDKQTLRQIAALEAEYNKLQVELNLHLESVKQLQITQNKRRNAIVLLLLAEASPFSPIVFH